MNQKERVITAFNLERPDIVPVTPFGLGVWTWAYFDKSIGDYINKPEEYAKDIIKIYKTLDQDMVFVGSGCNNFIPGALGGDMVIRRLGAPNLKEPLIKTEKDIEQLDVNKIYENDVINTVMRAFRIVNEEIGDQVLVGVTSWTPISISGQLLGNEIFLKALFKNPDLGKEVLSLSTDLCIEFYKYMMENGLEFVSIADGLASGDVVSRRHFGEICAPYIKKVVDYFKKRGLYVFLHICGQMGDRLDLIREIAPHCYSMDFKVDLSKAKEVFLGNTCYAGNINPTDVLAYGTPEDVKNDAVRCLEIGAKDGGFILMPGCDVPHETPIENLKAMMKAARNYKL